MRQVATLGDLKRYCTLREVLDLNELLDLKDDADWLASEQAKRDSRR